jgi:hypothetical protein
MNTEMLAYFRDYREVINGFENEVREFNEQKLTKVKKVDFLLFKFLINV